MSVIENKYPAAGKRDFNQIGDNKNGYFDNNNSNRYYNFISSIFNPMFIF